jgi:hypothetical protein
LRKESLKAVGKRGLGIGRAADEKEQPIYNLVSHTDLNLNSTNKNPGLVNIEFILRIV